MESVINQNKIDLILLQKMIFIYNALEDGWTVTKKNEAYIFRKDHEGKKEVYLDSFLEGFLKTNLDINKIMQKTSK